MEPARDIVSSSQKDKKKQNGSSKEFRIEERLLSSDRCGTITENSQFRRKTIPMKKHTRLQNKIPIHHEQFACQMCSKTFTRFGHLRRHEGIHGMDRPLV